MIEKLIEIVKEGAEIAKRDFNRANLEAVMKSMNDYVTETDKNIEKFIKEKLFKEFRDIPLLTEEELSSATGEEKEYFCLDPLDGTNNFVHRIPIFCTSLALIKENEIRIGVVYDALHDELFYAQKGRGAYLNGKRIYTSKEKSIENSFIATGFPFRERKRVEEYLKTFEKVLKKTGGIRRCGSAAIDLCYTASSRFEAFWEFGLKPWDIAAGTLIVEEAGGKVSDINGEKLNLFKGDILAAANSEIWEKMVETLNE